MHREPIGLTSSVPVEVLFAANAAPVDLNNLFIGSPDPASWVLAAEQQGFPRTVCSWIKGNYFAAMSRPDIRVLIGVTRGDCSNTHALLEVLHRKGKGIMSFEYPRVRDRHSLQEQVEHLMDQFHVSWEPVMEMKRRLDRIRRKLVILDELTWKENRVSGEENHLYLVASSDFNSDADRFENDLEGFLSSVKKRPAYEDRIRIGLLGVPPIVRGLHRFVESLGARVVFNEVQRQFAMPHLKEDLIDQYLAYTYPYDVDGRIEDIREAVHTRRLDGLIHYTQSFCFRQIQDMVLRAELPVPILTLEGDRPGNLDAQTRNRIEAFLEVLS